MGQLRLLQHTLGTPADVNGWPKDLEWVDEIQEFLTESVKSSLL